LTYEEEYFGKRRILKENFLFYGNMRILLPKKIIKNFFSQKNEKKKFLFLFRYDGGEDIILTLQP